MAKTQRKYKNVLEMIRKADIEEEVRDETIESLNSRRIVSRLMSLRACAGLSQKDIAEQMECSQATISKLENSVDDDLKIGEIKRYAEIVGGEFSSNVLPNSLKPVDRVKCLAFGIKHQMEEMAQLAHRDETIAEGVSKFFFEVFANVSRMFGAAVNSLPNKSDGSPYIKFEATFEVDDESEELKDTEDEVALH
ncbi:helix-turn-helix domain-containing protein [Blastopirellula sp. J2-11]|uniref:helix-turn-helix domain-containing protein n=1 Tax=Blastopirellula sp. J2-11 TaxID=2943192 RepID=UPI0021C7A719|nr:helix-turn-helix domain-containing protein [Blastopirellula sp. J2-11]UUO06160.1 helix-turn-helix domain-containing protein [Blastopirellula sp. J2-11]